MNKILLISAAICLLSACNETIEGDGNIVNEERELSQFNSISISGVFTIHLAEGEPMIAIRTDQNLLEHIETTVSGEELVISSGNKYLDTDVLDITVYYVSLEEIEVSGAAKIISKETIDGKSLELDISGAGEAELDLRLENFSVNVSGGAELYLSGYANEVSYDLAGAAEVHAFELETNIANIDVAGASELEVNVENELNVEIAGAGEVKYIGDPKVKEDITGAGEIKKM